MTHGFDDEGSQFDAQGNMKNWWTPEDKKNFDARGACIARQFDGSLVEDKLHENGKLVEGESIADFGGLAIAYAAYQKSLKANPGRRISTASRRTAFLHRLRAELGGKHASGIRADADQCGPPPHAEIPRAGAAFQSAGLCESVRLQVEIPWSAHPMSAVRDLVERLEIRNRNSKLADLR